MDGSRSSTMTENVNCVSSSMVMFTPPGVLMEISGGSFNPRMCTERAAEAVRAGLLGNVMDGSSGRPTTNGPLPRSLTTQATLAFPTTELAVFGVGKKSMSMRATFRAAWLPVRTAEVAPEAAPLRRVTPGAVASFGTDRVPRSTVTVTSRLPLPASLSATWQEKVRFPSSTMVRLAGPGMATSGPSLTGTTYRGTVRWPTWGTRSQQYPLSSTTTVRFSTPDQSGSG
mmetsp:Transcript_91424/g.158472  ORF Transcript_91424/g.158472 Transcript_91424/m.158472 type:complete len:228 (-) Transcript_91424:5351-6034(-)